MLSFIASNAQIKNTKTETVKIYGNCGMCETTIEKAGNVKKTAQVDWNKDTKTASITFDSTKTNQDEILKRIALAGYDSDKFLAPDDVYAKLPECCLYERVNKPVAKTEPKTETHDHSSHTASTEMQEANQLTSVFNNYFSIKDALVNADVNIASSNATELATVIKTVDMGELSPKEHTVWMKVMKELSLNTENISKSKDVVKQRRAFALLSKNVYELANASKQKTTMYYQNCPMYNDGKGATWLSKSTDIKNPYYGSKMLTCGSTIEKLN